MERSAGLLLHRTTGEGIEVFLVHPGGPFWARKDLGAWSIPKGEIDAEEDPLAAAIREVEEETGYRAAGPFLPLGEIRQKAGKRVLAWAAPAELDPGAIVSNAFEIEWPPRSGRRASFPEVDRAGWFSLGAAREKILGGQAPFLERLAQALAKNRGD